MTDEEAVDWDKEFINEVYGKRIETKYTKAKFKKDLNNINWDAELGGLNERADDNIQR